MNSALSHSAHPFEVVDGSLQIGGMPLRRLANRIGSTPFYAYDRSLISQRVAELRKHLPSEVQLHYAIKANPMPALVHHLAQRVDGFDVASAGEMKIALDAGMPPTRISFAGPGKSDSELARAVAAGVLLNVESDREVRMLAELQRTMGIRARVSVRVNPSFELKSSGMKMGGGAKQFGVDAEQVPVLLRTIGSLGLEFEGFHIFSGSQNLNAEAITEAQANTFQLALALAQSAPSPVRSLNIGGGFGISYFPGEASLDLSRVGKGLASLLPAVKKDLPQAQIVIELGRYVVGESGIYVCRVLDRKISRGQVFLVTDGGLHHHLAASGNFGQVIRKNFPAAVGTRMGPSAEREAASVVGPLCTPLDFLAERMELVRAEVGDLIVIFQSGAYGLTASPTQFLGHPPPAEVLV